MSDCDVMLIKTLLIAFYSSNDSLPSGFWDSEGCNVTLVDGQSVTCQCNHLTHFAILLSPGGLPEVSNNCEKCIKEGLQCYARLDVTNVHYSRKHASKDQVTHAFD